MKDEGDHAALLHLCETPEGPLVLKSWRPRSSRVYRLWARVLMGREIRMLAALEGCPGVPAFAGRVDAVSFVMEYVPGAQLKRDLGPEKIAPALDRLEVVLGELHARRFVHLDINQKLNVLVGENSEVWLVDFGQGLFCDRLPLRLLFPWLRSIDRRAVLKYRARYVPHTLPEAHREQLVARYGKYRGRGFKNFHRRVRELLLGKRK